MLRTVTSVGNLDQFLPDVQSLTLSPVFSQAGSVIFTYPQSGKNYNLLVEDTEIAVMIDGVEAGALRCILEQIEGDDANEAADGMVWTFTCRTTMALFDRAVVYPKGWPGANNPPTHSWTTTTAGGVLKDLVAKAQGRGTLTDLTLAFDNVHDSAGQAWAENLDNLSYDAGTKYSDIIQGLVDGGYLEVSMDRRTLSAYNPGTLGVDRSTGTNPLRFHEGRDLSESPRKVSTRDLATYLLVAGTNNAYVEQGSASDIVTQWGRRESYYSANNSDAEGVLRVTGSWKLATLNRPLLEVTHGLVFEDSSNPRPIRNFGLGDWGLSDVGRGWERYRIKQWVMVLNADGTVNGSVTLNDLIAEQIDKLNSRLGGIENGSSATGGSDEVDDGKAPAVPTGLNLTSDYYLSGTQALAIITANWVAVTTNADGSVATDLNYYLVRWKYSTDTNWRTTQRIDNGDTVAYFDGLFPNQTAQVQVEAVDKYNRVSGWSPTVSITTALDTIPPVKPSAPVVVSNVGTLRVTWSGLDYLGSQQAPDFKGVEVHIGTNGTFTPDNTTLKDFLTSRSTTSTTITGLTYGTDWFARLVAVDTTGNRSAPSDLTSTSHAVLNQIVSVEIGTGQVGLNNTAFSDVGNLLDDGSFEIATKRADRQTQINGTHLAFDSSVSSSGAWSLRSDSFVAGTVEYFTLQDALPVKPGERIFGALDLRATSGFTGAVNLDIAWFNGTGTQIDSAGNPIANFYTLAGTANTVADNNWHARVTGVSLVAPPGVATMRLLLYTSGRTAGTVWADAIEVRKQIDTLLIQQAAITTALIANLAVNNAKISDLSVGKITAGTLNADIIVGSRIKTADTGARTEMNTSGFGAWDSSNTQTFSASSSDGSIVIIGSLKSGPAGNRVEINPSGGLPEIRFYPSTGSNYAFINAFSPTGSGSAFLGLNSGQSTLNGQTSSFRIFMADDQASFETIISATQAKLGTYITLFETDAAFAYCNSDGSDAGFVYVGKTSTTVGYSSTSDSNDTWWYFNNDGTTGLVGRFPNSPSVGHNEAIWTGDGSVSSAFQGVAFGYGVTMLTTPRPLTSLYYVGASQPFSWVSARSTTGFTASWNIALSITVQCLAFRM
jgi:hypothetical protein